MRECWGASRDGVVEGRGRDVAREDVDGMGCDGVVVVAVLEVRTSGAAKSRLPASIYLPRSKSLEGRSRSRSAEVAPGLSKMAGAVETTWKLWNYRESTVECSNYAEPSICILASQQILVHRFTVARAPCNQSPGEGGMPQSQSAMR